MKKTRIVSLLLLVVVCTVALCACQPERQQIAQKDFAWVETFGMMPAPLAVGNWQLNHYQIVLLTDSSYKMVEYGDVYKQKSSSTPGTEGSVFLHATPDVTKPSETGDWGAAYHSFVVLYFLDDSQNVVGYAVVELWNIRFTVYYTTLIKSSPEDTTHHKDYEMLHYGQVIKSVKFRDGAISFEQAQSVVESQFDLPQQSAN